MGSVLISVVRSSRGFSRRACQVSTFPSHSDAPVSSWGQLKTIRGVRRTSVRGLPVQPRERSTHSGAEMKLSLRGEELALRVKAGAAVYFLNMDNFLKDDDASFLPEDCRFSAERLRWKGCPSTKHMEAGLSK